MNIKPYRRFLSALARRIDSRRRPEFLREQVAFTWPAGKRAALSLSFDDARLSQIDIGLPLLDRSGLKATFYVSLQTVKQRLAGWQAAVANRHEIGNHSINHPCAGNFSWGRRMGLENYTLRKMRFELGTANRRIKALLGVTPHSFAYPCGQTFVGRGRQTRSYVPIVADLFTSGRGWLDEAPNDPGYCDLAQITGLPMDNQDFEKILPELEKTQAIGQWLVLVGHEIGETGQWTTRVTALEKLLAYASDPANGFWVAPVGTVAQYILEQRRSNIRYR